MTKKAMKLLLMDQIKSAIWFLCIYALIIAILSIVFHYIKDVDRSWMGISSIYSPKVYLLVMGIVYPLISAELYLSRGLTRRQYFWALTGAIGILSLGLLLPMVIAEILMGTITPMSVIVNLIQMPLFFLMGWTIAAGFQFGKWYTAFGGILCVIVCFHILNALSVWLHLPEAALLGTSLILLAAQINLLPRVIHCIPIKG